MQAKLFNPPKSHQKINPSNVGVAFSGSGFLFPAHVGALHALTDFGCNITNTAGTSGGGLIAALLSTGMSVSDMHHLIMTSNFSDMMKFRLWGWWNGLCNPKPLHDFMSQHTNGKAFAQSNIPLTLLATDLNTQSAFEFSNAKTPNCAIADACRATSSIPFIYPAFNYKNAVLVDGGITNNIPVSKLLPNHTRIGIDIVEAVDNTKPSNIFSFTEKILNTLLKNTEEAQIQLALQEKAFIINVYVDGSFLNNHMSPQQIETLYSESYQQTINTLDLIKKGTK
jgi:NTE family protein